MIEKLASNGYFRWIAGAMLVLCAGGLLTVSVRTAMLDALKLPTVEGAAMSQRISWVEQAVPQLNERLTKMDVRTERIENKAEAILERVIRIESRLGVVEGAVQ